jgi:DNA-binding MarR family transcriptional regulator
MPSADSRPEACSNFKLRQLMRRVSQLYDVELGRIGLKTTQYSLLSRVLKLGPIRPVELAEAMAIDASTLTRNLKPLIDAGWITVAKGADARSRLLSITAGGRDKRNEGQRHWKAAQDGLDALLGVERVIALHTLIDGSLERFAAADSRARHE